MKLEIAKENLFKTRSLKYLEALKSKIELIKHKEELPFDVESIEIIELNGNYYLKYMKEDIDNFKISQAEKEV